MNRAAIISLLKQHDIMPTPQRVEIATVMLAEARHLSADQVLGQVAGGGVSKATVYNTLGLFAARGLLRQVVVDSTKLFYDSNTTEHFHFYNVDDGTLTDVAAPEIPLEQLPQAPDGTCTESVDLVIRIRNQHEA